MLAEIVAESVADFVIEMAADFAAEGVAEITSLGARHFDDIDWWSQLLGQVLSPHVYLPGR